MLHKAVFFDRDGVLNYATIEAGLTYAPAHLADLTVPEDASMSLKRLKAAGFILIGVTNQPDVSRGKMRKADVLEINAYLSKALAIDKFYVCFHDNHDNCHCRKPKPGMLVDAKADFKIDFSQSFMLGDRDKDILAGQKVGCKTIWMRYDQSLLPVSGADFNATSLTMAVDWILGE